MTESNLMKFICISVRLTIRYAFEFALEHEEEFKQWLKEKKERGNLK